MRAGNQMSNGLETGFVLILVVPDSMGILDHRLSHHVTSSLALNPIHPITIPCNTYLSGTDKVVDRRKHLISSQTRTELDQLIHQMERSILKLSEDLRNLNTIDGDGVAYQFHAGVEVQLLQHVGLMKLNGPDGDVQHDGNLFCSHALADEL